MVSGVGWFFFGLWGFHKLVANEQMAFSSDVAFDGSKTGLCYWISNFLLQTCAVFLHAKVDSSLICKEEAHHLGPGIHDPYMVQYVHWYSQWFGTLIPSCMKLFIYGHL